MKIILAAGILVHKVFPNLSQEAPPDKHLTGSKTYDKDDDLDVEPAFSAQIAIARPPKPYDTEDFTRFLVVPATARTLTSSATSGEIRKDCDPFSQNPDVGILSCDSEYECIPDEGSSFGGHCIRSSAPRELEGSLCRLCPYGSSIGGSKHDLLLDVMGYPNGTCGDIYLHAYVHRMFDEVMCEAASGVVQQLGCCVTYGDCNICGEAIVLKDAMIEGTVLPTTCGDAQLFLNQSTCEAVKDYLYKSCCEEAIPDDVSPSSSPTNATVTAPVETPPDEDTPPPTSDSAGIWWPSSSVLVTISLTVVAVGASVLN